MGLSTSQLESLMQQYIRLYSKSINNQHPDYQVNLQRRINLAKKIAPSIIKASEFAQKNIIKQISIDVRTPNTLLENHLDE